MTKLLHELRANSAFLQCITLILISYSHVKVCEAKVARTKLCICLILFASDEKPPDKI